MLEPLLHRRRHTVLRLDISCRVSLSRSRVTPVMPVPKSKNFWNCYGNAFYRSEFPTQQRRHSKLQRSSNLFRRFTVKNVTWRATLEVKRSKFSGLKSSGVKNIQRKTFIKYSFTTRLSWPKMKSSKHHRNKTVTSEWQISAANRHSKTMPFLATVNWDH